MENVESIISTKGEGTFVIVFQVSVIMALVALLCGFFFRITFTFYFITTKNKKFIIPTSVNLISTGYSGRFSRQEANDRVNDGNLLVVYGIFLHDDP